MNSLLEPQLRRDMKVDCAWDLTDLAQEEWLRFWRWCEHSHPRQHLAYAEVERAKKRTPLFVSVKAQGKLAGIAVFSLRPLLAGKRASLEAVCLRGPACDDVESLRVLLRETAGRFNAMSVGCMRVSPYWVFPEAQVVEELLRELGFVPYRRQGGPRSRTGFIDVSGTDEEILASFSPSTRRDLRRAQRQGVVVRPAATVAEAELFFREVNSFARQRDFPVLGRKECRVMFQEILQRQEEGIISNAFCGSAFVGGLLITRSAHTAHLTRFVVARECPDVLANVRLAPVIWWPGFQWARDHGCRWVDVEGYREDTDITHCHHQIHAYKKGFGPKAVQIVAEHVYACSPLVDALRKATFFASHKTGVLRSLPYHIRIRMNSRKASKALREQGRAK